MTFNTELGKLMHGFHNGKLPHTFEDYFCPVTSVNTH